MDDIMSMTITELNEAVAVKVMEREMGGMFMPTYDLNQCYSAEERMREMGLVREYTENLVGVLGIKDGSEVRDE